VAFPLGARCRGQGKRVATHAHLAIGRSAIG
jgi:hypothetical protein